MYEGIKVKGSFLLFLWNLFLLICKREVVVCYDIVIAGCYMTKDNSLKNFNMITLALFKGKLIF